MATILKTCAMLFGITTLSFLAAAEIEEPFPKLGIYYVVRDSNIRKQQSADSKIMVENGAERGDSFVGYEVKSRSDPGKKWLRITEGEYRGGYIWRGGLSDSFPPQCKETKRKTVSVVPNQLATTVKGLASLPAPEGVPEDFEVSCRVDENILEVFSKSGGGVLYVLKRRNG